MQPAEGAGGDRLRRWERRHHVNGIPVRFSFCVLGQAKTLVLPVYGSSQFRFWFSDS